MAQVCSKCGKKIGMFSNNPLNLFDERVLCYECAEPIANKLDSLYYLKSQQQFEEEKEKILNECNQLYDEQITNDIEKRIEQISGCVSFDEVAVQRKNFLDNYMLTTGFEFSGYTIKKYMGVISGQVVLGTGFLSEFTASFADFFGEESNKFANKLETAKNAALERLIEKSEGKGGNAVIGVDFDYITFHGNMIGVIANGTSVIVEEIID